VFGLLPGMSITLPPLLYHEFWAEAGTGPSIVGEVSSVNDDETDNVFVAKVGRFPSIDEDVPPTHKLCTEY
jgi:D-lyxose ketol-isomerase